jgi:glycosyltransferase involved in cell wall biosynthesis
MAGDAALQCNADDVDELARLMRLVHDDPARRGQMIAAGRACGAQFTWRSTARVLLDLCLKVSSTEKQAVAAKPAFKQTSARI